MEIYTVTVTPPGANTFRVLIPFLPTSSVSALASEVKKRISHLNVWPNVPDISLHLGQADGPILYEDDALAAVLPDPKVEITATSRIGNSTPAEPPRTEQEVDEALSETGDEAATQLSGMGQTVDSAVPSGTVEPSPNQPFEENASIARNIMGRVISDNQAAIRQALGDVPEPVPRDLNRLVGEMNDALNEKGAASRHFAWKPIGPIQLDSTLEVLGTVIGPPDTPYSGGIFHIQIQLPKDYPFKPPRCLFLTKVYHPTVHETGNTKLDILENWSPMSTLKSLLRHFRAILKDIDPDKALMPDIANQFRSDRPSFEKTAREWTKRYATGEIIYPRTRQGGF